MREKLHDVIHNDTGEVLLEERWPVDVAIFLKRNPGLTVNRVRQHEPGDWEASHDLERVDDVWVDGVIDYSTAYVSKSVVLYYQWRTVECSR